MSRPALDASVEQAIRWLREQGFPAPRALLWTATGVGELPSRLRSGAVQPLHEVEGVPPAWRRVALHAGNLEGLPVWLLDDHGADPAEAPFRAPWEAGFPCWLAAEAGAALLVHSSAGSALPGSGLRAGGLAVLTDHIDLSGANPLFGLGESRLGPLFPDLSRLHQRGLAERALAAAEELGFPCGAAVAACTAGPALETPAERRFLARAGADLAVQGLGPPLIAAGHAGMGALALVAVLDEGEAGMELAALADAAELAAPRLEELVIELAPDLERAAAALAAERGEA